jgi:hypothetical protein
LTFDFEASATDFVQDILQNIVNIYNSLSLLPLIEQSDDEYTPEQCDHSKTTATTTITEQHGRDLSTPALSALPLQHLHKQQHLLDKHQATNKLKSKDCVLYFSKRIMNPNSQLHEYLGSRNEKTKVAIWLQTRQEGPPRRYIKFDPDKEKEELAYLYKKQQEQQQASIGDVGGEDEDEYLNSEWADTDALKKHFQGVQPIVSRWK